MQYLNSLPQLDTLGPGNHLCCIYETEEEHRQVITPFLIKGSGYPQGLKGHEMLLEGKILAVADVVEAMASHRPYRPALGLNTALEQVDNNKGILYDPKVVEACLRVFKEQNFDFD